MAGQPTPLVVAVALAAVVAASCGSDDDAPPGGGDASIRFDATVEGGVPDGSRRLPDGRVVTWDCDMVREGDPCDVGFSCPEPLPTRCGARYFYCPAGAIVEGMNGPCPDGGG